MHREMREIREKPRIYYRLNYLKRYRLGPGLRAVTGNGHLRRRLPHRRDEVYVKKLLKRKDGKRFILLNPGPVLTTATVKNSMIQYDLCHRDRDFSALLGKLKVDLLPLFGADESYRVLFISGSGTAGLEAMLASLVPRGRGVLVLSNGAFGERLNGILELHQVPTVYLRYEWGETIPVEAVEAALIEHPDLWGVVMNHHETSVGLLNPVDEVGRLCTTHGKVLLLDAISSFGAERTDVLKQNIGACVTSSNKCLHSVTGISIICVRKDLLDGLAEVEPRSFYLDLYKHYRYLEDSNQTPFTPNVTSFFALERAVRELIEEGTGRRHREYVWRNSFLRRELGRLGFEFLTATGQESATILTVGVPPDIDYRRFYNLMKGYGFLVYDCKPPLADRYFQVANMGDLKPAMLYDFVFLVARALQKLRKA